MRQRIARPFTQRHSRGDGGQWSMLHRHHWRQPAAATGQASNQATKQKQASKLPTVRLTSTRSRISSRSGTSGSSIDQLHPPTSADSATFQAGSVSGTNALAVGRRRDCHFADALSPSLLKHRLDAEGGAAEWTRSVSPVATWQRPRSPRRRRRTPARCRCSR